MKSCWELRLINKIMKKQFILIGFTLVTLLNYAQNETKIEFSKASIISNSINSENHELMPLISNDGNTFFFVKDEFDQTNDGYKIGQNIWTSSLNNNTWTTAEKSSSAINNKSNNAVIGLSEDGQRIYLINAYEEEKEMHGIAVSHLKGNHWSKPEQIVIQGIEYKNDHYYGFYIAPNEKVMLISMETNNGIGKEDLYISFKNENAWSEPRSLGNNVNSSGFEISPFLSPDQNRIYFSSNGFGGIGDADLFYIEKINNDWFSWTDPVNLGKNINSTGFDAYLSITQNNTLYFSSSRNGSDLNIYSSKITVIEPVIEEPISQEPVIEEPISEEPKVTITTPKEEVETELKKGEVFKEFYFNVNSSYLDDEAKEILNTISELLKEDPKLKIELTSHADNRNDEKYNLWLTNKRYERAKSFLVTNGVSEKRIQGKGVGESQPKVKCDKCSEKIHRQNRVTEIRIY